MEAGVTSLPAMPFNKTSHFHCASCCIQYCWSTKPSLPLQWELGWLHGHHGPHQGGSPDTGRRAHAMVDIMTDILCLKTQPLKLLSAAVSQPLWDTVVPPKQIYVLMGINDCSIIVCSHLSCLLHSWHSRCRWILIWVYMERGDQSFPSAGSSDRGPGSPSCPSPCRLLGGEGEMAWASISHFGFPLWVYALVSLSQRWVSFG